MLVSTRGRYALRMMIELASIGNGEYTSLKEISKDQEISMKYLEQITTLLSKAGLLRSARGAKGGYMLARKPEDYSVREILLATEGSLAPTDCIVNKCDTCSHATECATMELWEDLDALIRDYFSNITLADLLKRHEEKGANAYVI